MTAQPLRGGPKPGLRFSRRLRDECRDESVACSAPETLLWALIPSYAKSGLKASRGPVSPRRG